MLVYKDVISGDEMFSDAYDIKEVDGCLYKVAGNQKTEKLGVSDAAIGGNKSAEGGDEDETVEDASISGLDIVLNNRLVETQYTKAQYTTYIKKYMKDVKEYLMKNNPDRVDGFMTDVAPIVKSLLKKENFGKYQFYTGETMNQDGMVALLDWGEDENTPTFTFFKDGMLEEKC
ncbi:translationally-controlled tumor protein homolog [Glandiceps talaboti]